MEIRIDLKKVASISTIISLILGGYIADFSESAGVIWNNPTAEFFFPIILVFNMICVGYLIVSAFFD